MFLFYMHLCYLIVKFYLQVSSSLSLRLPSISVYLLSSQGGGRTRNEALAAKRTNHDPPAVGWGARAGHRHPDPGRRDHQAQEAA